MARFLVGLGLLALAFLFRLTLLLGQFVDLAESLVVRGYQGGGRGLSCLALVAVLVNNVEQFVLGVLVGQVQLGALAQEVGDRGTSDLLGLLEALGDLTARCVAAVAATAERAARAAHDSVPLLPKLDDRL